MITIVANFDEVNGVVVGGVQLICSTNVEPRLQSFGSALHNAMQETVHHFEKQHCLKVKESRTLIQRAKDMARELHRYPPES
jgi:hypothetical protein